MRAIAALLTMLLAGCGADGATKRATGPDQCMRAVLFKQCLAALPAGPVDTKYNDWDEVVAECQSASYYQSLRLLDHINPECRV